MKVVVHGVGGGLDGGGVGGGTVVRVVPHLSVTTPSPSPQPTRRTFIFK